MEIQDRLKTLTKDQQLRVVERVFQKLHFAFGNQMLAKWQNLDMHLVYEDWAEALLNCSLGAINHGIETAKEKEYPPSQGEFVAYCKQYKPPMIERQLLNLHVVDKEHGLAKINEIRDMLAKKMTA